MDIGKPCSGPSTPTSASGSRTAPRASPTSPRCLPGRSSEDRLCPAALDPVRGLFDPAAQRLPCATGAGESSPFALWGLSSTSRNEVTRVLQSHHRGRSAGGQPVASAQDSRDQRRHFATAAEARRRRLVENPPRQPPPAANFLSWFLPNHTTD